MLGSHKILCPLIMRIFVAHLTLVYSPFLLVLMLNIITMVTNDAQYYYYGY